MDTKKILKKIQRYSLLPFIIRDWFVYKSTNGASRFTTKLIDFYPCIKDRTITTGFDRHYVYHTSWAARVICEINPKFHIDISSSLYFSGICSAFIPIHFYDYRPAKLELPNLESGEANLHHLPFDSNSVHSISCMHTIEHIGLGRYGDQIDAEGDLKAIAELKRVITLDGNLIIVVPIGRPRIEFNAHRIYSYEQIIEMFVGKENGINGTQDDNDEFKLKEFTFIPETEMEGPMIRNADPKLVEKSDYACGCFWFVKIRKS